jgi:hypothetical protein
MPADAHHHGEPVTTDEVRSLLARLVGLDVAATHGMTLDAIGLDDDLGRFRVWEYAAEEFAERSVAEPDVGELLSARTADELVETIVQAFASKRQT